MRKELVRHLPSIGLTESRMTEVFSELLGLDSDDIGALRAQGIV
jgi:hypothetical protein